MQLNGHICPVDEVSECDREQMFALMQRYYENVRRDEFFADLDEKDSVILARHPGDESVCGFSTQVVYTQQHDNGPIRILFSGDTIIDRRFWARNPLAKLWGQFALSLIDLYPHQPLYWFLISKGYRTYRFLPVFFEKFYPRHDEPTPEWAESLITKIASGRFGTRFDESTGILKAAEDGCRLSDIVADIPALRMQDPHIAFFHQANPGHAQGDELCCIAPITRANFRDSAYRVIGSACTGKPQRSSGKPPKPVGIQPTSNEVKLG